MITRLKKFYKNRVLTFFQMLFYNTVCKAYIELFGKHDNRNLKYRISLCLIFKNEAPFLKEWLDYHLCIGVDHFYLYNNNSDDNYLEIINPYIKSGHVTLVDFPYDQAQMKAYKDCFENYKRESKWIGFTDADEFICLKRDNDVNEWIKKFDKYPAVLIHWLVFGTSGIIEHDYTKNVIEQYHLAWDHFFPWGKCIINTRFDISNFDTSYLHHLTYCFCKCWGLKFSLPAINQFKYFCTWEKFWGGGSSHNKLKNATIQLNHYYSKSWNIYKSKMNKSDVYFEKNPKGAFRFFRNERPATRPNYDIYRFLIDMKLKQKTINWK